MKEEGRNIRVFPRELREQMEYGNKTSIGKLFQVQGDDRFVIRKLPIAGTNLRGKSPILSAEQTATKIKLLFDELKKLYDIETPSSFIIANNEFNRPDAYAITRNIRAKSFAVLDNQEKSNFLAQLKALFAKLMDYYESKSKSGEDYLQDLTRPGQYSYGELESGGENKFYCIDPDGYFSHDVPLNELLALHRWIENAEKEYRISFDNELGRCAGLIQSLRQKSTT